MENHMKLIMYINLLKNSLAMKKGVVQLKSERSYKM